MFLPQFMVLVLIEQFPDVQTFQVVYLGEKLLFSLSFLFFEIFLRSNHFAPGRRLLNALKGPRDWPLQNMLRKIQNFSHLRI